MRALITYAWSLPVTWQRRRSHHSICHTRKPHVTCANFMAVCFIEPQLWPLEVLHCKNRNLLPFWWPSLWPDDLHVRTWSVFPGDTAYVRKWTSYVKAFESYRITAWECVYLVTWSLPVTWQRWQTRHRSAIPENPMLHANVFYTIEVYIAGIRIFDLCWPRDLDLDPMTFMYEPDRYTLEIQRMCKYELLKSRLSKVIAWQTYIRAYIQTDRHDRNYTTPLQGWSKTSIG